MTILEEEALEKAITEKYRKAKAELTKEKEKKSKQLKNTVTDREEPEPFLINRRKEKTTLTEANEIIKLERALRNKNKQARIDNINEKEKIEKAYEPITKGLNKVEKGLDKVEKAVKQTDGDLVKKFELVPLKPAEHFKPMASSSPAKQMAIEPQEEEWSVAEVNESNISLNEDGDEYIKTIIEKTDQQKPVAGVTSRGLGVLPRKYLPFPDKQFGIWADDEHFYIGSSDVIIDGNDILVQNNRYKGTHGLWKLLTVPNKKKLNPDDFTTYFNEKNFTEKEIKNYKEILKETNAFYQNNDPLSKKPKSSQSKKWKELISPIWKDLKSSKVGSGLIKYSENPIEYKYIDNLNQLQQRLYYIAAQEQAGNNNFHNEKMSIINFITEQLEKNVDNSKGTEYIFRIMNNLPKGILKTGSGMFNTLINKLPFELHLPGNNYCGPGTKLNKRLNRGDKGIHKLDEACKQHDIFYRDNQNLEERHTADKALEKLAEERILASDSNFKEKLDAGIVAVSMKTKRFFGMGVRY